MRGPRSQRQRATCGHCIDRVENEIDQRLSNFTLETQDDRLALGKLRGHLNDDALLLWHVAPSCACQSHDLTDQPIEINRNQRQLGLAVAVEFAHPRDRLCDIVDGVLDGREMVARLAAQVWLGLQ
jgi:hypothetical protein